MAETTNNTTSQFAGNIDLSPIRKKRFTINGDENSVVELNTSDFSIINRMSEALPKLEDISKKMSSLNEGISEDKDEDSLVTDLEIMANNIKSANDDIKGLIDYIFDSNVCGVCCPSGSMLDIIDGQFRYEFIIEALMGLYEETIKKETKKLQTRMAKHTDKYTK